MSEADMKMMMKMMDYFVDHELTRLSRPGDFAEVYVCKKPSTSCGSFLIIIIIERDALIFVGDMRDGIIRPYSDKGVIAWATDAVESPSHFFSKIHMPQQTKVVTRESIKKAVRTLRQMGYEFWDGADGDVGYVLRSVSNEEELLNYLSVVRDLGYEPCAAEDIDLFRDFSPHCWRLLAKCKTLT